MGIVWNGSLEQLHEDEEWKDAMRVSSFTSWTCLIDVARWVETMDRRCRSSQCRVNISWKDSRMSHSLLTCRDLPDCCRMTLRFSLLFDDPDDDDDEGDVSCWDGMTNGVRISGCSRMLGTLPPPFSLVLKGNVVVIARRCIRSSTLVGLIVTSGCSKIRSSLWERFLGRLLLPFFADARLLKSTQSMAMINADVEILIWRVSSRTRLDFYFCFLYLINSVFVFFLSLPWARWTEIVRRIRISNP